MVKKVAADSFTFKGASRPNAAMGPVFEQLNTFAGQLMGGQRPVVAAVSGGQIVPTGPVVSVSAAGPANLDNIDGSQLPDGAVLFLAINDPAAPITVRHNTGAAGKKVLTANGQNWVMVSTSSTLVLVDTGTAWVERGRSFGGDLAGFRAFYGITTAATAPVATDAQAAALADTGSMMTPHATGVALHGTAWAFGFPVSNAAPDPVADAVLALVGSPAAWSRVPAGQALNGAPYIGRTNTWPLTEGAFGETNHNLGGQRPRLLQATLYTANGDAPNVPAGVETMTSDVVPYCTSTLMGWASNDQVYVVPGSSGGAFRVTPSKWSVIVRAFK